MSDLTGNACLVTGGSRGIGRAIALELGRRGASVGVGYAHDADAAEAVVEQIATSGGQGYAFGCDVQDPIAIESAVADILQRFGKIDVLVNNAGITRDRSLAKMSPDEWDAVLETNLSSVFYTCRAVARPMMKKRGGAIVNVSTIVGLHGNMGQANYGASKAGIIGFTKSLARELGSRGVRANVVAPGYIHTRLTDVLPEEATNAMLANTPLGKLGDPEDIAGAVRFLCSDEASFITGEVLLVDGGLGM